MVGTPPPLPHSAEFTVIHGLRAAVEALAEPTEQQKEKMKSGGKVVNKARVICITSARDDSSMKSLEEIFYTVVAQQNMLPQTKPSKSSNEFLKIDQCHLVKLMNFHRCNFWNIFLANHGKCIHYSGCDKLASIWLGFNGNE